MTLHLRLFEDVISKYLILNPEGKQHSLQTSSVYYNTATPINVINVSVEYFTGML